MTIFVSAGLSGAYADPSQMQGHGFQGGQPQQYANYGNHNYTHGGNHHRSFPQNATGFNMTAFSYGNHNRAFPHNATGFNMTAFGYGNHGRAFPHNATGFNMTAFKSNYPRPGSQNATGYGNASSNSPSIPSWIKNTAKYWSQGQVNDTDFVGGLQYMIQTGIIHVPTTQATLGNSHQIPKWVKSDANLWATGQMSENDFIQSIQYLISAGIIKP